MGCRPDYLNHFICGSSWKLVRTNVISNPSLHRKTMSAHNYGKYRRSKLKQEVGLWRMFTTDSLPSAFIISLPNKFDWAGGLSIWSVRFHCSDVAMFPDLSSSFGEYSVSHIDRNDKESVSNKPTRITVYFNNYAQISWVYTNVQAGHCLMIYWDEIESRWSDGWKLLLRKVGWIRVWGSISSLWSIDDEVFCSLCCPKAEVFMVFLSSHIWRQGEKPADIHSMQGAGLTIGSN